MRQRTKNPPRPAEGLLEIAGVLLLVQGAVAFVASVEVGVMAAATAGLLLPAFLMTFGAAVITLLLAAGIRRRSRRARKIAVVFQVLWLIAAAVDLLLAIFLAQRGLEIVPLLTRIVLPYSIFRILRRPQVRREFDLGPTRRQRRKTARLEASPA